MPDQIPEVSVIIPAYNEENVVAGTLQALTTFLKSRFSNFEIIVVDDGSSDRTPEIVSAFFEKGVRLIRNALNMGKGFAIRQGILDCKGKMIVFMDADLPYDLSAVEKIVSTLERDYSLAIGSRRLHDSERRQIPLVRYIAGQAFSLLVHMLMFPGIHDTQCGLKGFTAEAAHNIFKRLTIRGFGFDVEALYIARKMGYSIAQVPVKMTGYRYDSRVKVLRDSGRMFLDLFLVRCNDWRGIYDSPGNPSEIKVP